MSTDKFYNFLKAVETVKKDYTCGHCKEMCVKPVTLSSCFHMICSDHFRNLKLCPTCKIPLDGCITYVDEQLDTCVESIKELDNLCKDLRPTNISASKPAKSSKNNTKSESGQVNKQKVLKSDKSTSLLSNTTTKGIEKRNSKGETVLHVACRLGKVDRAKDLLNMGANSNTKDNAGWTPLHEVVQNGNLELVRLLLQFNTLIDVPGQNNETPLHEAIRYSHVDIATELVKNGADLEARNCKGETPLQLATEEVKSILLEAAEDLQQSQGVNITHIANIHSELDFDDIRVFCLSHVRSVSNKLKLLAKSHSNLHLEAKFTKKVTHIVIDEDEGVCVPSTDILQGIVYGVWILSSQWVNKSTEDSLEHFEEYEVKGIGNKLYRGPKISRYNKYKQLPGLFDGCHFYLHNFTTKYELSKSLVLTKAILSKLIIDASGIVLRRVPNPELIPDSEKLIPYHAKKGGKLEICSHYIIFKDIYQPMYNMAHIKALPLGWLIECIEKYELCDP